MNSKMSKWTNLRKALLRNVPVHQEAARENMTPAGVSHDSPRTETCTFQGPGLQNTTKIQRKDPPPRRKDPLPPRERKRMKTVAGEGRKRANGRSCGGVVQRRGAQWRGPRKDTHQTKNLEDTTPHNTHNTHTWPKH